MRKTPVPKSVPVSKPTTLQRILTTAVNELGMDTTVAILNHIDGPFAPQVTRGFSDREVQAVLRALSGTEWNAEKNSSWANGADLKGALNLRVVAPSSKNLLAVPLKDGAQLYGVVVLGKRGGSAFSKKERASVDSVKDSITKQLREANLFDGSIILNRPKVAQESPPKVEPPAEPGQTRSYTSPQVQDKVLALLTDAQSIENSQNHHTDNTRNQRVNPYTGNDFTRN